MIVLVTGASGFLGRHVVGELLRQGHRVRAGVRAPLAPATCAAYGWSAAVEQVLCDIAVERGLAEACAGVDAVIHLAAAMTGSDEEKIEIATAGTRRLLVAMPVSARLLLASSFSVYDWDKIGADVVEDSPLLDGQTMLRHEGYARAKVLQEETTRRLCGERGIGLTVLRPATVWSDSTGLPPCVGPKAGPLALVIAPDRPLRLTHVLNCAAAFVAALDARAVGLTFNIDDGFVISAWDFAAMASGARRVPVAYGLAARLSATAAWLLRPLLGGRKMPGLLIPERLRARFHRARSGHAALTAATGWRAAPKFVKI
jgi:UDP-glucose 4-epimerase